MTNRKQRKIERLLELTNWRCGYCGIELDVATATRDHIVPRAAGGPTLLENLRASCQPCNERKGWLSVEQFRSRYFAGAPFWYEYLERAQPVARLGESDRPEYIHERGD